jgi:hypothetical protein
MLAGPQLLQLLLDRARQLAQNVAMLQEGGQQRNWRAGAMQRDMAQGSNDSVWTTRKEEIACVDENG